MESRVLITEGFGDNQTAQWIAGGIWICSLRFRSSSSAEVGVNRKSKIVNSPMLVVIADDLSGAAELAGAALRHGLTAEVQTAFAPASQDRRGLRGHRHPLAAPRRGRPRHGRGRPERRSRATGVDFQKCDSALRGPVLAEARAIAAATGLARITILAANPSRGRIVHAGISIFEGRPLHETAFARDPEHPRLTSRVADLLGPDLSGVNIPDAETFAEVAQAAGRLTANTLPVGAARFLHRPLAGAGFVPRDFFQRPQPPPNPPAPRWPFAAARPHGRSAGRRRSRHGIPIFALPHDAAAIVQALRAKRSRPDRHR